jgi:hypothetical protein
MGESGRQCTKQTVCENAAQVEREMMSETVPPKGSYFGCIWVPRLADMERVRHNQRTAHPQAMETSDETDDQRGKQIEHRNLY